MFVAQLFSSLIVNLVVLSTWAPWTLYMQLDVPKLSLAKSSRNIMFTWL